MSETGEPKKLWWQAVGARLAYSGWEKHARASYAAQLLLAMQERFKTVVLVVGFDGVVYDEGRISGATLSVFAVPCRVGDKYAQADVDHVVDNCRVEDFVQAWVAGWTAGALAAATD